MRVFKNLLSLFFILLLSTAIFMIVNQDKKVTHDILTTTLKMFGDDLLALVPEGEQRNLLADRFQDFVNRAEADQVPPDQIEYVAATILNLSNTERSFTSDEILSVLQMDESDAQDTVIFRTIELPPPPPARSAFRKRPPMTRKEKIELAERLAELEQFQARIKKISSNDSSLQNFRQHVFFTSDSMIKVAIKNGYRDKEFLRHRPGIERQLSELEEQELVEWVDHENDTLLTEIRIHRDIARMAHRVAAGVTVEMPDSLATSMDSLSADMDSLAVEFKIKPRKP